jgi:tRNA G10  N-methylase Trm11
MIYLATCVSGLEDVAAKAMQSEKLPGFKLLHKDDGLLLYSAREFKPIPYLNNIFLVLAEYQAKDMAAACAALLYDREWDVALKKTLSPKERNFRVMLSDENQFAAGEKRFMGKWLERIEDVGLKHAKERPDIEVWLLRRRDNHAYLLKRLTQRPITEKNLQPGELRPELALLITHLSEPMAEDIVLDPFAGQGGLAVARRTLPHNIIFASDISVEGVKALKAHPRLKTRDKHGKLIMRMSDATKLDKFEAGFVHKIITDPPWGLFEKMSDQGLWDIYEAALREQCRVVKKGGFIIWLTARKDLAHNLGQRFAKEIAPVVQYDILVNGQKAVVCKWTRS